MGDIEIDGMILRDVPLKDAVDLTRDFLDRPGLDLVICITEASFFRIEVTEEKKNFLESADLNVFDTSWTERRNFFSGFLQHSSNMKTGDYLEFLFKYLQGTGRTVTILTEDIREAEAVRDSISMDYEEMDIRVCGKKRFETDDAMYNELNISEPAVVISLLPWRLQDEILKSAGSILIASVWLSLPREAFADKRLVKHL